MAKYNTRNPLGSKSPKDLSDNAENLDNAVNTPLDTWTDRFGKSRLSLAGMSKAAGDASLAIGAAEDALMAAQSSGQSAAAAAQHTVVAQIEAQRAKEEANRAERGADAAALNGGIYESVELGLSSTSSGTYFSTPAVSTSGALDLYKNNGGAAAYVKTYPSEQFVAEAASIGRRNGYLVHGTLHYQYFDRGTASWVISHGPLTVMLGAGRGQVNIPAAENVVIPLNRAYYVDISGVESGATVHAQVSQANFDSGPTYGVGGFVDDLKLPLFTYRGGGPGGLLLARALDQDYNWPAVSPTWFRSATNTKVVYDPESRTLSWSAQIVCPVMFASTRRVVTVPAHNVVFPAGGYQVAWLDLRKIPQDATTPLDPSLVIKVGAYGETLVSDTAYRGQRYQIPLFLVGIGTARPAPGFFEGEVEGVFYPSDDRQIAAAIDDLQGQVSDLSARFDDAGIEQSDESRDPVYLRDGVIYRHDAGGEKVVSDQAPKVYSTPPYWRGRAVISVLDRATLAPSTAVAIRADGGLIHPSAENLITILAGYGQSNARGMRGNVGPAIQFDPRYAETMLMFDGSAGMDVRLGIVGENGFDLPLPASALTGFQALRSVDTQDNAGTTFLEGAAAALHSQLAAELSLLASYLYFTAAKGGSNLAGLVKGTVPYANFMTAVERAKSIAASIGKRVWLPAILWNQGESDTANTDYAAQLVALRNDMDADIKAITGQSADVQFVLAQPSSFQSFRAVLALQRLPAIDSRFHLACAGYPLPYYTGDYLHYDRIGHFKLGEYYWKALRSAVYGDRSWKPLQPESVSFNGANQVQITFHVPAGELVLDPDATDKDGNWGFQLFNGSTQVAIADKSLVGNVVTLTAESNLTPGNAAVRYALAGQSSPRTAAAIPRGRLRDSDSTPSLADGAQLYNWCVHFEETF
ncbi:sialate O-acetylesterase [Bordetella trematum]|uniref:sialate O-acetylesterase n=1 Tax=Bordetella trematum TaxID=123899 RepID=UPI003988C7A5